MVRLDSDVCLRTVEEVRVHCSVEVKRLKWQQRENLQLTDFYVGNNKEEAPRSASFNTNKKFRSKFLHMTITFLTSEIKKKYQLTLVKLERSSVPYSLSLSLECVFPVGDDSMLNRTTAFYMQHDTIWYSVNFLCSVLLMILASSAACGIILNSLKSLVLSSNPQFITKLLHAYLVKQEKPKRAAN